MSVLKQGHGGEQASSSPSQARPVSCLDKPQSAPRPVSCLHACCAATAAWPSAFCSPGGLHFHHPPIALWASMAAKNPRVLALLSPTGPRPAPDSSAPPSSPPPPRPPPSPPRAPTALSLLCRCSGTSVWLLRVSLPFRGFFTP